MDKRRREYDQIPGPIWYLRMPNPLQESAEKDAECLLFTLFYFPADGHLWPY